MEKFKSIKIDNRLNKSEIKEVKELSKDEANLKILLETNTNFKNFINSEYRWANENCLAENGKTVKDLQIALGFRGSDVDGAFGKQTFFALIRFQKANNLVVDGLAGNKTQAVLGWKTNSIKQKTKKHIFKKQVKTKGQIVKQQQEKIGKNSTYNGLEGITSLLALFGNKDYSNSKIREHYKRKSSRKKILKYQPASFLSSRGYPTYEGGAMCGLNVGNALIDSGISGLPTSGRDGYTWIKTLDNHPDFIKKRISHPREALPNGVLVYDRGYGRTYDRRKYGHVEIVTNDGYWYGGPPKKRPGGSTLAGFTGYVYYPKVA